MTDEVGVPRDVRLNEEVRAVVRRRTRREVVRTTSSSATPPSTCPRARPCRRNESSGGGPAGRRSGRKAPPMRAAMRNRATILLHDSQMRRPGSMAASRISRRSGRVQRRWRGPSRTTGTRPSRAHERSVDRFTVSSTAASRASSNSSSGPRHRSAAFLTSRVLLPFMRCPGSRSRASSAGWRVPPPEGLNSARVTCAPSLGGWRACQRSMTRSR